MIHSLTARTVSDRRVWSGILRGERLRLALLFLIGLLSRLPFTSQILYHWDSVNFALALYHFDVAADQPQVPGYILYVMLGRLVNYLVGDPQVALVGISLIGSGLAVVALYLLGRAMFSRDTGLIAALFLASSPLFWFYGEVALPHSLDTLAVILVAWMLYRAMQGEARLALPAAVMLAIAGGLRPQTQVFLMPLALLAGWRLGWRRALPALVAMGIVDILWFVPLVGSVGGFLRYFKVFSTFAGRFNETTSIFSGGIWGLQRNLRKLGMYTLYAWSLAFIPAMLYGLLHVPRALKLLHRQRLWFLFIWIVPSILYYTAVHMGQQGLVFVFLPALLLISAESLRRLAGSRWTAQWGLTGGLVALQAVIFLAVPMYPLGGDRFKLLTWQTIRQHDQYYQQRLEVVRREFPSGRTVIMGTEWRHLEYYLSDYPLIRFSVIPKWELGEGGAMNTRQSLGVFSRADLLGQPASPDEITYLVLFDDELLAFLDTPQRALQLPLPGGARLMYLKLNSNERLYVDADSFGLLAAEELSAQ
jgi:4-amino-4-deoxy-L-arabinose transferase-like glycosyltransferase